MHLIDDILKRFIDIILSALCLLIFSPLILWIFIRIHMEGDGPVIYSQERIGKGGKTFMIYKFRTMHVNAEKNGPELETGDDDIRLTQYGRFLRSHHLDELPQLWNVLIGDMSFVGPRPERQFFIDKIMERNPRYSELFALRPGVTSYATLHNGYTDTMDKMLRRLELDLEYLRHHNILVDARILLYTFVSIVSGKTF